jgi:hypothetical protein
MAIKNAPIYSDLNLSFTPHPLTGDLVPLTNVDAIRRAIRTLFSLEAFDIPFEPKKKSGLKQMLFEPSSHLTEVAIQTQLEWLFKKLEKRANLISTTVNADDTGQGYAIVITYNIKSLAQTDTYSFYVERVR